ncbi:MAG: hypothetical protein M3273_05035 [Actinomycetota bacterium]|nr:hypothetical protein [Actinomycetota bacterium]
MKKFVIVGLAAGLVAASLAGPAVAKKKPKPVPVTMYMHGAQPLGEIDGAQWAADGFGAKSYTTLDTTEPSGAQPKSQFYGNPALNDQCSGLPLGFPTFTGDFAGTIVGDAKLTIHTAGAPGKIIARIWGDVGAFTACNDAYIPPTSEIEVDVPAGQGEVEAVFPGLNLKASTMILIEILTPSGTDAAGRPVGRLLYDSTATPSRIEFSCIPASGTACTP